MPIGNIHEVVFVQTYVFISQGDIYVCVCVYIYMKV